MKIKEPVDPRAIEGARRDLKQMSNIRRGAAAFALYDTLGKRITFVNDAICHAQLRDCNLENVEVAVFVNNSRYWRYKKETRAYIEWMCSEGPGSVFVLNKDNLDECCDLGVIWDYAHATKEQSFWMAKALRYPYEEDFRAKLWFDYVQLGVHPMTALIAANILNAAGTDLGTVVTHGCVFNRPPNITALRQALTTKWDNTERTKPWEKVGFSKVNSVNLFFKGKGHLFQIGRVKQVKQPDGWGGYTYKQVNSSIENDAKHLIQLTEEALKDE